MDYNTMSPWFLARGTGHFYTRWRAWTVRSIINQNKLKPQELVLAFAICAWQADLSILLRIYHLHANGSFLWASNDHGSGSQFYWKTSLMMSRFRSCFSILIRGIHGILGKDEIWCVMRWSFFSKSHQAEMLMCGWNTFLVSTNHFVQGSAPNAIAPSLPRICLDWLRPIILVEVGQRETLQHLLWSGWLHIFTTKETTFCLEVCMWNWMLDCDLDVETFLSLRHVFLKSCGVIIKGFVLHSWNAEAEAAYSINICFQKLFKAPLWIPRDEAKEICKHASKYFELYQALAWQASQEGRALFLFNAKVHMLSHLFRNLEWETELSDFCLNIMVWGVQLDEDLVGKASRLTRHVSSKPAFTIQRTLQRWLIAAYSAWEKAGMYRRC